MKILKCDRCDTEYTDWCGMFRPNIASVYEISSMWFVPSTGTTIPRAVDLCRQCNIKLEAFLNGPSLNDTGPAVSG